MLALKEFVRVYFLSCLFFLIIFNSFFDIHRVEKGPRGILNFEAQKDALTLEEQEVRTDFIY